MYEMNNEFNSKLRKKVEIIDLLLALILVLLFIISLLSYGFYKEELNEIVGIYSGVGLFLTVAFLEFVPQLLSPFLPLAVSIPSLGVFNAVIITIFGSLFGCFLGFEVGRKYGWRFIYPFFEENTLKKIFRFWQKHGKWFVLLAALTPVPDVPLIYGALGMNRRDFIIFGIITKIISFVVVGCGIYFGFFQYSL